MDKDELARLRNKKLGFVFQSYNLLPRTTALENVELPLFYNSRVKGKERLERSVNALEAVGLKDRMEQYCLTSCREANSKGLQLPDRWSIILFLFSLMNQPETWIHGLHLKLWNYFRI